MRNPIKWLVDRGMEDPRGIVAFATTPDGRLPHVHSFHELIYLMDGETVQQCGTQVYRFLPGELYFLMAGEWHIAHENPLASCIVVNFYDLSFAETCPGDYEALRVIHALQERTRRGRHLLPLSEAHRPEIERIMQAMVAENARALPGMRAALKSYLQMLCVLLWRATELGEDMPAELPKGMPTHEEAMERVVAYLQQSCTDKIHLETLARVAGMCRSLLCASFKQYTGMTIVQYLNRLRVIRACQLLETTDTPVPQLAEAAGFPCESHFFALFKTHTGLSPHAYRRLASQREQ